MISVVTPSFNQLDWLELAIASVADQGNVPYEHIIQDGGTNDILPWSTVRFPDLLTTQKLKVFQGKDEGMYDAVNRGLKAATGDICAYLNCDEQYLPCAFAAVSDFFSAHPEIDILFGDALILDAAGKALAYRRAVTPTQSHIRASHLNTLSCATFFRRRILDQGHVFDPRWKSIGDAVWIYRMLQRGIRAAAAPRLFATFTMTGQNLSTHDPRSVVERTEWTAEIGPPSLPAKYFEIMLHRLRKLFAGAYRSRSVDYEVFTLDSRAQRQQFQVQSLGGKWPDYA